VDHISKALEKAQTERKSVRNWVSPQAPAAQSQNQAPSPIDIDAARPVELDPEHLREHFVLSDVTADDPVITDVYRLLRTRVLQAMRGRGWHRLGITSAGPKAGKTLNAINLAIAIAREGSYNVLLVDADVRRPSIAHTLGLDVQYGMVDYLTGEASLDQVVVRPANFPNLTIIPGQLDDAARATPEALGSDRVLDLLDAGTRKDVRNIVIVDLPPVLVGDDVLALAPRLDGLLLVVSEGVTDLEQLERAVGLLKDFPILGTVLNNSRERSKAAEGYYYQVQPT
jgi:Mrp family chromosome partitioning ATPase